MDINEQLQPIVATLLESLKGSLEQELRGKITEEVIKKIANTEIDVIVKQLVAQRLDDRIAEYDFANKTKVQLDQAVTQLTNQVSTGLAQAANEQITSEISRKVAQIDIKTVINSVAENKLANLVETGAFPPGSIPHASINFKGFNLSGDYVSGGIIKKFGSQGIEDLSSFVQLTLMDHASAFEGPLFAPELTVKGKLLVEGDLVILGSISTETPAFSKLVNETSAEVRKTLDTELFTGFSDTIFGKIRENGLDLDRLTQGGKEVISGNKLGYHITDSNLQRLGIIRDFQTQGENYLSQTLYVTEGRIGINTMDPSSVFSLWDEEVEINISKREQDTGYINTPRNQRLILGSHSKQNIILHVDGSVQVENISIGKIPMKSADTIPNYPGQLGQIVWNEVPSAGGPIGWVCLGSTRWAKFGLIE